MFNEIESSYHNCNVIQRITRCRYANVKDKLICSGYTLIYRTEHLEFDTDACSRSAMSQKRHPIWFPHCPTCTVTNSRGILCRPPRNSTRRGWTWTSMRSLHFKCRSFHKPAALLWTIPPLPFFSFSLPFRHWLRWARGRGRAANHHKYAYL